MASDEEFLEGIEDIPGDEGGSSMIFEKAAGHNPGPSLGSDGTRTSGIPMGPLDGSPVGGGFASHIDPMSVRTPRRKMASRPKPWASGEDYGSFLGGGSMGSFNQSPEPKDMGIEKEAGPLQQTTPEPSETNKGFVGKVKPPKPVAAKDEEGGNTPGVGQVRDIYSGEEQTREFADKLAKVQKIGRKEGAKLLTFAEYSEERTANIDHYKRYLNKRCYACADAVDQGVMCHECYAAVKTESLDKKAAGWSKNPVVPKGGKKEKFDWDKQVASESQGEETALFHDEKHYHAQEQAIMNDPVGAAKEEVTLTRGKEKAPKPDKATMERYAEKDMELLSQLKKAFADNPEALAKVEAAEAAINKKVPIQRAQTSAPAMNPLRRSQTEERGLDMDGEAGNDYSGKFKGAQVVEYTKEGAKKVHKDYPYQLMKQSGISATSTGVPQSEFTSTFSAPGRGLPVSSAAFMSGIPISSSGVAEAPLSKFAEKKEAKEAGLKIGSKVTSDMFQGEGEVMDVVRDDSGSIIGAMVEAGKGLMTVAASLLKSALRPGQKVQFNDGTNEEGTVMRTEPGAEGEEAVVQATEGEVTIRNPEENLQAMDAELGEAEGCWSPGCEVEQRTFVHNCPNSSEMPEITGCPEHEDRCVNCAGLGDKNLGASDYDMKLVKGREEGHLEGAMDVELDAEETDRLAKITRALYPNG